jgi:aminopeptidase-like protein
MHRLATRLFPICRSLSGDGVRETLSILHEYIPLTIHEVPSGTKVFDWTVPPEWNIRDAYVADESGNRIIDFKKDNLHVVGYSTPIDATMSLSELEPHLHSLPEQPDAVPYVTSYYKEAWGFCLSHKERARLREGMYRVVIGSTLEPGHLTYGEILIPGESDREIFLSTYICHPSMANNELSGPSVAAHLARLIAEKPRRYTYRFVFVPETIGAITYLAKNLDILRERVIAGFNITCVGDDRAYSFLPSRYGSTLADKVTRRVLQKMHPEFIEWSFLDRGSDERQYCSPLVDLPVVSIMRSKYGEYPEYHTSLDDLRFVTPSGLQGAYDVYAACIDSLENARRYVAVVPCEPQLGKHGLYKTEAKAISSRETRTIVDVLAYADGTNDIEELSALIRMPVQEVAPVVDTLIEKGLLRAV